MTLAEMLNPTRLANEVDGTNSSRIVFPSTILTYVTSLPSSAVHPTDVIIVGNKGLVASWWVPRLC